ncbi:GDYXXLXY domain-containing protein [Brevibacillus sp. SYSU BS000544]|uniref:GDYXXLXY domain-containing protein n=1 Tax=Brevibacillus sp. SYSU BS000544 TaxID=3416443 RepID=UPI003CE55AC9
MRERGIQTGYVMGVAALLSSIIYFFAANWGGLDRFGKIGLSVGLLVMFYLASFVLGWFSRRNFLTNILLLSGCIAYGVSTALLGQIYNSHADSYLLFLIWLIPALLLSVITRFQTFYVLSFLLTQLTMWFYLFPSSVRIDRPETELMLYLLGAALVNGFVFLITELGRIQSEILKFLSFFIGQSILLILANTLVFESYQVLSNVLFVAVILGEIFYFLRFSVQKSYAMLTGLFASFYVISKYIELAAEHYSELFFLFGIFFFIIILLLNLAFLRFVQTYHATTNETEEVEQPKGRVKRDSGLLGHVVSISFTVAAIFIGIISIVGFTMMIFESELTLLIISFLMLVGTLLQKNAQAPVRYTFLTTGLAIGLIGSGMLEAGYISLCYVILLGVCWVKANNIVERVLIYSTFAIQILLLFFEFDWEPYLVIMGAVLIHAGLFILHLVSKDNRFLSNLKELSYLFFLGFFFVLTFMREDISHFHLTTNVLFFIVATLAVFIFLRNHQRYFFAVSLTFWFLYIVYKYYDVFWSLLHKSITLLFVSALFLFGTYVYERRGQLILDSAKSIIQLKKLPILLAIVIQFVFIGTQIVKSETILAKGTEVTLLLAPIDPRSLLQGDYVRLNYEISSPEGLITVKEDFLQREKVQAVLRPDNKGVYHVEELFRYGERKPSDTVFINGVTTGGQRVIYGIESFFIPEGSGRIVEEKAKYALVRVASNGDAILVRLLDQDRNAIMLK